MKNTVRCMSSRSNFVKFKRPGRPKSLSDSASADLVLDYYTFQVSFRVLARRYGVSTMTVRRVVRDKALVSAVLGF